MHENQCKHTPHCLFLCTCPYEWLHLQLNQMLSKNSAKVEPLFICWSLQITQVKEILHRIVKQCELLHLHLVWFHLAQQCVGKYLAEIAQSWVTDVGLGGCA